MLMSENPESIDDAQSVSTAQAARMLGMSTTMLQKMVDQEKVKAWKTPGGHRRIDLASLHAYQGSLQVSHVARTPKPCIPVVKVIVDDPSASSELMGELEQWSKFFDTSFWSSMPEALLSFADQLPDILVVQMSVPLPLQLSTVLALGNFLEQAPKPFSVVFLSNKSELSTHVHEGTYSSIQILTQPLNRSWLKAFLTGVHAASQASNARAKSCFD